jgi:hypothetical protein
MTEETEKPKRATKAERGQKREPPAKKYLAGAD